MTLMLDLPDVGDAPHVLAESAVRPHADPTLRLTTPRWERLNPPWWLVDLSVRACYSTLDEVGSFCILAEVDRNNFVQTAFCPEAGIAWRLEWRSTAADGSYAHYYAVERGDDSGDGVIRNIEMIIKGFRALYAGDTMPAELEWKPYAI